MTDKLRSAETVRNEIEAVGMTGFSPDCGLEPAAVDAIITARDREVRLDELRKAEFDLHRCLSIEDTAEVLYQTRKRIAILETEDDNG